MLAEGLSSAPFLHLMYMMHQMPSCDRFCGHTRTTSFSYHFLSSFFLTPNTEKNSTNICSLIFTKKMGASSSKNRSPRQTPQSRTTIIDRTTSRDRTTRRATSTRQQRHVRKRRETPHKGDHTAAGDNREETNIDLDKFKDLVNQVF